MTGLRLYQGVMTMKLCCVVIETLANTSNTAPDTSVATAGGPHGILTTASQASGRPGASVAST